MMSDFLNYIKQQFTYENYLLFYGYDSTKITETSFNSIRHSVINNIATGTYEFAPSKTHKLIDALSRVRIINCMAVQDKFIDRLTFDYLIKFFKLFKYKSKSIHSITKAINNDVKSNRFRFFLRLDIQNYFPSINRKLLFSKLVATNDECLLNLIGNFIGGISATVNSTDGKLSISFPNGQSQGVPLGSAISQGLADLYLQNIDIFFSQPSYYKKISYHRFADDFCFLTIDKETAEYCKESIIKQLNSIRLTYAPAKLQLGPITSGFDFLGFSHIENRIFISTKTLKRIKSSLYSYYRYKSNYLKNHILQNEKTNAEVLNYIYDIIKKINLSIRGFNTSKDSQKSEADYLLKTYSLSRHLSISDDINSIDYIEQWIGRLNKYFLSEILLEPRLKYLSFNTIPTIASLKNWYFRYRRNLNKAITKALEFNEQANNPFEEYPSDIDIADDYFEVDSDLNKLLEGHYRHYK